MEQSVFDFTLACLSDLQLHYIIAEGPEITMEALDLGLRESILMRPVGNAANISPTIAPDVLYYVTDYYECNYIFFRLPGETRFLFVGPYLLESFTESRIHRLIQVLAIPPEQLAQLRDYYDSLPCFPETHTLHTLMQRLFSFLLGGKQPAIRHFDLRSLESPEEYRAQHEFATPEDPALSMRLLEKRYRAEDELLDAVSRGNTEKAVGILNSIGTIRPVSRFPDPFRSAKNLSLSLNTLLRRAAYETGVHPFYINSVSNNYAGMIEQCGGASELGEISLYMAKSYCTLVKSYNMSSYSEPVRHILVTVDASLAGDLSLKRFAEELFLNSSYLSALFKKELGMTLTDYVNANRIGHAKKLLKSTSLQIQDIAVRCGIPDIHYFTRLFKRETGISPREWRAKNDSGGHS